MTRNDTSEETTTDDGMLLPQQQHQQQQQQQQELVNDVQHLNKNDRKAKNKPRKKHPIYNSLRKASAAKKSCGSGGGGIIAKEPANKNNGNKVQDKRDNILEQQQKSDGSKVVTSSPVPVPVVKGAAAAATKLTDIPDSWELLYDLNLLPGKWSLEGMLERDSVASIGSSYNMATVTATESIENVLSDFQQTTTEESSSCDCDGFSRESSEEGSEHALHEEFDKKMSLSLKKQQTNATNDISSTPSETISMRFLLHPQHIKESTSNSLRCSRTIIQDELQAQPQHESMTITNAAAAGEPSKDKNMVTHTTTTRKETSTLPSPKSEFALTTTDDIASHNDDLKPLSCDGLDMVDLASTSNDVETVTWSSELQSNAESEQTCGGDPYKNWMERPRRGTLRAVRYKTEMCRTYEEGLHCTYGVRCQFAHGFHELRFQPRHPKHKTELCHMFHSMGICRYGRRCSFVHTENLGLLSQMRLSQQQQQQLQQQQQQRMFIAAGSPYTAAFGGLAISLDRVHSSLHSSRRSTEHGGGFKNCANNDAAATHYYDVKTSSGSENTVVTTYTAANADKTNGIGIERTSSHLIAVNSFNDGGVQLQQQQQQHLIEEPQLQQAEDQSILPIRQEQQHFTDAATVAVAVATSNNAVANANANTNNITPRLSEQKMVCVVNGAALPAVPAWTNAVLYVPYEACSFQNAAAATTPDGHHQEQQQLVQPSQLSLRNSSNCTIYGHHQPQQQAPPPPPPLQPQYQQSVAAFQASNGIVYFNSALQIAPSVTATATTTAAAAAIVNNVPLYATTAITAAAAVAPATFHADQPSPPPPPVSTTQHIYQHLPSNFYAAAATAPPQPVVSSHHVDKYFQVVPHLSAAPYAGNVYYVAAAATTAAVNNPMTATYGNYAYATNA